MLSKGRIEKEKKARRRLVGWNRSQFINESLRFIRHPTIRRVRMPADTDLPESAAAVLTSKWRIVNLDSLRQCFLDPDVRIIQDFEYKDIQYPGIKSVSVSGGFLEGQTASFNAGLNSVVGGKGTGKSLLVELMRFALNQSPERSELSQDHHTKLENRLIQGNYVEIEFTNKAAQSFSLKRNLRIRRQLL